MSTKDQIEKIEEVAYRIWQKYSPYTLQQQLLSLWDDMANQAGMRKGFMPLYPLKDADTELHSGILGSGGFTTGREELMRAARLKNRLGWSPINYTAVITNRNRSKAKSVAQEFDIPALVLDYSEWRSENDITGSTKLFGFTPGSEPPREVLEERIKVKKSFDHALHEAILERIGQVPKSISLRGYDFILTDQLFSKATEVDNTHPANLIIRETNGEPAYAGWQESAYNKMREDGITSFTTSLIRVGYISDYSDLIEVDAGELLAISPGNPDEYDKIEDHYLLTLKATGLLPYFWGLSKEQEEIEYLTKANEVVNINQRIVIVGDKIMSGREVFGQSEVDLKLFSRCL
jgi:folate-dependent phosphoribosylglycinamide formyltransferase PurN